MAGKLAQDRKPAILVTGKSYRTEPAGRRSCTLADHDVFVSAPHPDEVRAAIETELGASFSANEDPDPVHALVTGATKVFFHDSHEFEDDRDFAVTQYRCWIASTTPPETSNANSSPPSGYSMQ
jgi:hypothetical protein